MQMTYERIVLSLQSFQVLVLQATLTALEFVPMEEDIIVLTFSVFAFICNGKF